VAYDASGNIVQGASTTLTMSKTGTPSVTFYTDSGYGTDTNNTYSYTGGTLTVYYVATGTTGQTFTFTATDGGLKTGTSGTVTLTFGAATKLAFTVQPTNTPPSTPFSSAVKVAVQDAYSNTVTSAANSITITGVGTTLSGTLTLNASSGVATFTGVTVGTVTATGCSITATAIGLTMATSNNFNVAYTSTFTESFSNTAYKDTTTTTAIWDITTGFLKRAVERPLSEDTVPTLSVASTLSAGYRFTPVITGTVISLGRYAGSGVNTTVRLWRDSTGTQLGSVTVPASSGWQWTALTTPVVVTPGAAYTVSVDCTTYWYNNSYAMPVTKANIVITTSLYGTSGARPTTTYNSGTGMCGWADIEFVPNEKPLKDANDAPNNNVGFLTTAGYRFTPNFNGYITALGRYIGSNSGNTTVRLWNDGGGTAIVTATVSSAVGWQWATLATPIAVTATTYYRVGVDSTYYWWYNDYYGTPVTKKNIYIESSVWNAGGGFGCPTTTDQSWMHGFADIEFVPTISSSVQGQSIKVNSGGATRYSALLTATATIPSGASITYQMTANGGTNWEAVTSGTSHTFTNTGTDLRWRATLTGTARIDQIVINY